MILSNEAEKTEFKLDKAKKAVYSYSRATGTCCSIIDSRGVHLYGTGTDGGLCNFCSTIKGKGGSGADCSNVHLYGSYQAERFGGSYIYFCPMGLVHWASPVFDSNTLLCSLIGGPVLLVDPDDFLLEDFIRKNDISDDKAEEITMQIKNVPVIQPEIVNHLSNLLCIVASSLSENKTSMYDRQSEYLRQMAQISESVQSIKQLENGGPDKTSYPFEKERALLSKIALGDKPGSQKILNEILGYVFFSSGKDFEVIKARVLELVVLLSRAAVEGGADSEEIFGLNYKYLSDINLFRTVEELTYWLSKIMARFTDCVFNLSDIRHKDTIYKAVDYIKRNYTERLTLEDVAGHVYLNPSYFSKIFKDEMKCSFVSYVNRLRIKMSIHLLSDTSIPLSEVSNRSGFEDQSYFTKVFKKATGMTPGKYREARVRSL